MRHAKRAIPTFALGSFLCLSATAGQSVEQQQPTQQRKMCMEIKTPEYLPCVTSCAKTNHVTTYQFGNSGQVEKNVEITTECLLEKSWVGQNRHADNLPFVKGETCSSPSQQLATQIATQQCALQTAQQTCGNLKVTPLSVCVEECIGGESKGTLIKKDYIKYVFDRSGGGSRVVTHDCTDQTVTNDDFFGDFADASNISIDDAIGALEDLLRTKGPVTIEKKELQAESQCATKKPHSKPKHPKS